MCYLSCEVKFALEEHTKELKGTNKKRMGDFWLNNLRTSGRDYTSAGTTADGTASATASDIQTQMGAIWAIYDVYTRICTNLNVKDIAAFNARGYSGLCYMILIMICQNSRNDQALSFSSAYASYAFGQFGLRSISWTTLQVSRVRGRSNENYRDKNSVDYIIPSLIFSMLTCSCLTLQLLAWFFIAQLEMWSSKEKNNEG